MDDVVIVFGRTLRSGFIYVNAKLMEYQPKEQMASCRKYSSDWIIVDLDCRINQELPRYLMLSTITRALYSLLSLRVQKTSLFITEGMFHVHSWDKPFGGFELGKTW